MTNRWLTRWLKWLAPRLLVGVPTTAMSGFFCFVLLYPFFYPTSGVQASGAAGLGLLVGILCFIGGLEWLVTGKGEL